MLGYCTKGGMALCPLPLQTSWETGVYQASGQTLTQSSPIYLLGVEEAIILASCLITLAPTWTSHEDHVFRFLQCFSQGINKTHVGACSLHLLDNGLPHWPCLVSPPSLWHCGLQHRTSTKDSPVPFPFHPVHPQLQVNSESFCLQKFSDDWHLQFNISKTIELVKNFLSHLSPSRRV